MCDRSGEQGIDCPPNNGTIRRGDLLVCEPHATDSPSVGRTDDEVRCSCSYFKPRGAACGEPCL